MSDGEVGYYYEISYEQYVELMRKWIEKSRYEMLFYLNMLAQCNEVVRIPNSDQNFKGVIDSYVCERYRRKFFESLDNLLDNMDALYIVQMLRDDFVFYVDEYGVPYAFYVPKELLEKVRRDKLLYI